VKLAGGPIDIFPLDPVVLFHAGVAVNAKSKNPNAARLAANFLLSRDGQGHLAKFGRLPTRGDVQSNPPGILERLHAKKVVPTLFKSEDEKKWKQTFTALFKQR
jgi:ABC-type Fe3+ transport system substrate-binding protein